MSQSGHDEISCDAVDCPKVRLLRVSDQEGWYTYYYRDEFLNFCPAHKDCDLALKARRGPPEGSA
jgi:hypothetical protein